jgi:WD40 repeat protein
MHARPSGKRSNPHELVHELSIVDRDTGESHGELPTEVEARVMSFSADGARFAVTGGIDEDARVTVFDVAARRALFTYEPPGTITRCAQFLPDNRVVVANARDVYVLPAGGGDPQFALSGHPKQVNAVALAPDGRRLLTASHDGTIRAWEVPSAKPEGFANTGEAGASFDWKIGAITALCFAPDGLTCAAAGAKGDVVVWDVDA